MANYETIIRLRPEMADFLQNRHKIGLRGDILTYWPNTRCDSYSTDADGFRHSTFNGKDLSVAQCIGSDRYGIVLGASNLFGFGVAGNEHCMPSLLAERFGFPFANAAMPGANSRNLHGLLVGLLAAAGKAPAIVILSNGGDLANFCESSMADPIFGSPNRVQLKALERNAANNDANVNFPRMLQFAGLWAAQIARVCRSHDVPLVLVHQSTYFEKSKPNPFEEECELGVPHPSQRDHFANHRKFDLPFYEKRKSFAENRAIPLAGWGLTDEISFIDEFHCDREGIERMTRAVGDVAEPLLGAGDAGQEPA